jgi:hypothetical protein
LINPQDIQFTDRSTDPTAGNSLPALVFSGAAGFVPVLRTTTFHKMANGEEELGLASIAFNLA